MWSSMLTWLLEALLENGKSKGAPLTFLQFANCNCNPQSGWVSILEEVYKLMSRLNLMADFSEFSRFYEFVFFICRENGQKNITVSRAVMAWRLVLAGRFRLLNQWCNFIEKNQRHNISEDTWRQALAFSRCVHENLERYDPEVDESLTRTFQIAQLKHRVSLLHKSSEKDDNSKIAGTGNTVQSTKVKKLIINHLLIYRLLYYHKKGSHKGLEGHDVGCCEEVIDVAFEGFGNEDSKLSLKI
ncbi:hypothetical protein BUALT_Bualt19G0106400 [Buddleja alternifolia]|uniref:Defective in cullin neddylation protein n=1 Tax=Buddleja alternifolia TaxID=168488 RepID=A0AAV6W246_9LAMI|nr:hypothetical protein BUALT_Bualt19G0106400 [Buddleja alternifolia]